MNDNICEFCGKGFKTPQNLKVHTNTAKYCLKQREECLVAAIDNTEYVCEYCRHPFTQKISLKTHYEKCIKYKDHIIETKNKEIESLTKKKNAEIALLKKTNAAKEKEFEKKVKDLENKIAELEKTIAYGKGYVDGFKTSKPPKITNNTTNVVIQKLKDLPVTTIEPFTISLIKKNIDDYTYDMYLRGELGVVQFITGLTVLELDDGTIEKNYTCTDRSRSTFHRLVVGKEWRIDGGARFINTVLNEIAPKVMEHAVTLSEEISSLNIKNTRKETLARKECDLLSFHVGVVNQKSKDREIILQKIKSSIKNINHIDVICNK